MIIIKSQKSYCRKIYIASIVKALRQQLPRVLNKCARGFIDVNGYIANTVDATWAGKLRVE